MTGRGRQMLLSQRAAAMHGLRPLKLDPPRVVSDPLVQALWRDIAAAVPIPLMTSDALWLELAARAVAQWRRCPGPPNDLRLLYRILGKGFIGMPTRRALIFGTAPTTTER